MVSIINSILDNDFYKITMQCAVVKCFPNERVRYQFINRGHHVFPDGFAEKLQEAVAEMAKLKMTNEEKKFLQKTCPYLDLPYIDFLEGYRYDPTEVNISQHGSELSVEVEGLWYRTILWEVPLLSIISEIYYDLTHQQRCLDLEVKKITEKKAEIMEKLGVTFAEFGTRRRHSYKVQDLVLSELSQEKNHFFIGTSNVHFAMKYGVKPIGTHAHEWFMFHAAVFGFKMANQMALENWVNVYRGDLGVALSDTYTSEVFFKQFDKKFAKLFDGVRHDSGDPLNFADQTIRHYLSHGINPMHKYIIFSDGLNIQKVQDITKYCQDKIGISFGIGTHLTNDVGLKPMNIVMKMVGVESHNGGCIPTVKLSDEKEKYTGDPKMIELAKVFLGINN
ncbi:nicotinate phosphoribosyltransferase [Amniculibacterium aquaticum]|uniref:nicotinate phosphoribosyltransferase n=1 Tax=Amniculibacterium aquaticum TaxID=2479858 RepID=UPI000F5A0DB4|nr:nicotinate phosphoribosyltransferase [Amniculibacterium aquaticum]